MSNDKALLQATLGKLLGFDDGAEDVLEHLLSIESKDVSLPLVRKSLFVKRLRFVNTYGETR